MNQGKSATKKPKGFRDEERAALKELTAEETRIGALVKKG